MIKTSQVSNIVMKYLRSDEPDAILKFHRELNKELELHPKDERLQQIRDCINKYIMDRNYTEELLKLRLHNYVSYQLNDKFGLTEK